VAEANGTAKEKLYFFLFTLKLRPGVLTIRLKTKELLSESIYIQVLAISIAIIV